MSRIGTYLGVGLVGAVVAVVGASALAADCKDKKQDKNLVETAVAAGSFKTLATALEAAGLVDALSGKGPFTVFAPTDEAFAKLPEGTVEGLLKDKEKLAAILKYHVVEGAVTSSQVVQLDKAETLLGQEVMIRAGKDGVKVNDAKVTKADIHCKNGVIHVIDTVLLPE